MSLRSVAGWFLLLAGSVGGALEPRLVLAGDGMLEINQACATQTGCFPGDTPGYPVTINERGSYRLTSELRSSIISSDVVQVIASDVTLDLAGFVIRCQRNTIPATSCAGSASTGRGILISGSNVHVENGTIRDMSASGIVVNFSSSYALDRLRLIGNGGDGLQAFDDSYGEIGHSIFEGNTGAGMRFLAGPVGVGYGPTGIVHYTMMRNNGGGNIQADEGANGEDSRIMVDQLLSLGAGIDSEPGVIIMGCIESLGRRCPPDF
jgi:hypothetical protein